jgi:hypothetical protein
MSGGDGLFEVDTAAVVEPQSAPTVPVKKTFRVFVPDPGGLRREGRVPAVDPRLMSGC